MLEKEKKKMPPESQLLEVMGPVDQKACMMDKLKEDDGLEKCIEDMSKCE